MKPIRNIAGYSLIELLVAMTISAIIGIVILTMYIRSSRTYSDQLEVIEAQQNVRAGLASIVFDLRMAGFDPTENAEASITVYNSTALTFTQDLNSDEDLLGPDETIAYVLDATTAELTRNADPVAEYIDALGFAYAFASNGDGLINTYFPDRNGDGTPDAEAGIQWVISDPAGGANWFSLDKDGNGQIDADDDTDGDGVINAIDTTIEANPDDIRAVKIWLLAHGSRLSQDYTNTTSYPVGSTIWTPGANDRFRRRLLTTTVQCKNMGY
jgi:type IV pilus assembly protein PilW